MQLNLDPDWLRRMAEAEANGILSVGGLFHSADLPKQLIAHVEHWLEANGKLADTVRWGLFPLGMVQRWIERAEAAEADLRRLEDADSDRRSLDDVGA